MFRLSIDMINKLKTTYQSACPGKDIKTINLDYKTSIGKFSNTLGYKDVSEVVLDGIRENKKLKYIKFKFNY